MGIEAGATELLPKLLFLLVLLAGVAGAAEPPRVRAIDVVGPGGPDHAELRVLLRDLAGGPAEPGRLAEAVRRLESVPGVGGVDVRRKSVDRGRRVDLLFAYDGRAVRLNRYRLTEERAVDDNQSWRLSKRVQGGGRTLYLAEGRLLHPYLVKVDAETIAAYYRARGYRQVEVVPEVTGEGELASVVMYIEPGPRHRVRRAEVSGARLAPKALGELSEALQTRAEEVSTEAAEQADAHRIREAHCLLGHPDARVHVDRATPDEWTQDRPVDVRFTVEPGPLVVVRTLKVQGVEVPASVVKRLSLREGHPFCPARIVRSEEALLAWLRDHGHPDAQVVSQVRRLDKSPLLQAVDVTLRVKSEGEVRVERIWFDGNRLTSEEVIRYMLAIEEGDLYRQSAVDASVQGIRRSGLFREVNVRLVAGSEPGRTFLVFELVENNTISVDVLEQSITFRNLDLAEWPGSLQQIEEGNAFRGGGQRLTVYAQPDWQGVRLRDDFVHRYLIADLAANRRTAERDGLDEEWYDVVGGFGVRVLANRFSFVPFAQLEWTDSTLPEDVELPVMGGETFTTALGARTTLDFNQLDRERIPYLGADGQAYVRAGIPELGGDFGWIEYGVALRGHIPLGETGRGQHFVLRLRGALAQVFPRGEGVHAHQRIFPRIRGYGSRGVGVDFEGPDAGLGAPTVRLGGLIAGEGTAEVRLPIPFGARNALSPFVDVASAGDEGDLPFADPFPSVGLAISFSFFEEKLEGVVWGAYPLRDSGDAEYVGGSIGGSF